MAYPRQLPTPWCILPAFQISQAVSKKPYVRYKLTDLIFVTLDNGNPQKNVVCRVQIKKLLLLIARGHGTEFGRSCSNPGTEFGHFQAVRDGNCHSARTGCHAIVAAPVRSRDLFRGGGNGPVLFQAEIFRSGVTSKCLHIHIYIFFCSIEILAPFCFAKNGRNFE